MSSRKKTKSLRDFRELVDDEQRWDVSDLLRFLESKKDDRTVLYDWTTPLGDRMVSFVSDGVAYVATVDGEGFVSVEKSKDFMSRVSWQSTPEHFMAFDDFSKNFWDFPSPLYHGTKPERLQNILKEGLYMSDETRGIANRHTGSAVFTSTDPEMCVHYGDALIEINTAAMKRDGITPFVTEELPVRDAEREKTLAWRVGLEEYDVDVEPGIDHATVVVYGHIPSKYLKVIDSGARRNPRAAGGKRAA